MSDSPLMCALRRVFSLQFGEAMPDAQLRAIGPAGIDLIKRFEGCAKVRRDGMVEAYPDPGTGGAPWTTGWGATGAGIERGTVWTQAECDTRLERDLVRYAADVAEALAGAATTQPQFDALVSFHYNTGAIRRATLTRKHCAGDFSGAARASSRGGTARVARCSRACRGAARRRPNSIGTWRELPPGLRP